MRCLDGAARRRGEPRAGSERHREEQCEGEHRDGPAGQQVAGGEADAAGVWAFTPSSFSALMGGIEPAYLKLMTKRLSDQGVLIRAARGVYVNPHARSRPPDANSELNPRGRASRSINSRSAPPRPGGTRPPPRPRKKGKKR